MTLLQDPAPTLIGRVVDDGGAPVPGAHVTVLDDDGRQVDLAEVSTDGRFAVRGIPGSPVTVLVGGIGHEPVSERLYLEGRVSHRSFRLAARELALTREPAGRPR
jgi:hypothetical protein